MTLRKKPAPKFSEEFTRAGASFTVDGKTYRTTKAVTLSSWKWEHGVPKFFTIDAPIHEGREAAQKSKTKEKMRAANVCVVTNLEDGLQYELVLGKIIYDSLMERYPNDGYVGKSFRAVRHDVEGKNWKRYTVNELTATEE